MNAFGNLPHPSKGLKPVKEMLLQELMHLVLVTKLSAAFLKMLDLVETCVLHIKRTAPVNLTALDHGHKHIWNVQVTKFLFESLT